MTARPRPLLAASLLFLLLLLPLTPPAARAAVEEREALGRADPKGSWRELTAERGTSACVGDPKTPICAVETVLACLQRGDWKLCESALPPGTEPFRSIGFSP